MDAQTIAYYQANSSEAAQRFEAANLSWLRSRFEKLLPARGSLLEVGCGSGRDAAVLLAAGYDVTAVDGSSAMLNEAARIHPELKGRLLHVPLPARIPIESSTFDGVYSIAALMHLETSHIAETLGEMARVTKDCGGLVLSVPARRTGLDVTGRDSKGRYFNMLDDDQWVELCRQAGYESVEVRADADGTRREVSWWTLVATKRSKNQ